MTKKDYVKFAEMFKATIATARLNDKPQAVTAIQDIVVRTAHIFSDDNAEFNSSRFFKASGV